MSLSSTIFASGRSSGRPASAHQRWRRGLPRVLPALLALTCLLLAGESRALSCVGTPEPLTLAALCVDGTCSDVITERQESYWSYMCGHETRPVIGPPEASWPAFATIAKRFGTHVTSGVYEIRTDEWCIHAMVSTNAWAQDRARGCRERSSVHRVSEDPSPAAFARVRSTWESRERLGLVRALPTLFFASTAAISVAMLATALIVGAPWVLASRAYGHRARQVMALVLAIPVQVLVGALALQVARRQPMALFGGDGGGDPMAVILMLLCLAVLVISAMLQVPVAAYHICRLAFRP